MAKMFAIVEMQSGNPKIDPNVTPYYGYSFVDQFMGYGAYIISGTNQQLLALNALPEVIGLVAVTDSGNVRWGELNDNFPNATRTRLNTWLTNRGLPTIPAGRTNRQVILAVFQRLNPNFDISAIDIADGGN